MINLADFIFRPLDFLHQIKYAPCKYQETLAIYASIHKWARLVDGGNINSGSETCGLCTLYLYKDGSCDYAFTDCDDCPIRISVGSKYCRETPYEDYIALLKEEMRKCCFGGAQRHNLKAADLRLRKIALDEWRFLMSIADQYSVWDLLEEYAIEEGYAYYFLD